jgi:glycosyltransferase involved in cell wall biosynthesis
MHILHVTAHLGGGVGKAHAALRAAMPADLRQTYLLLEAPRDRRYADEIAAHGGEIVIAAGADDIACHCASADIVQFEFWNHPKLFECLANADFPPMRVVFWSHVSGLFTPVIPREFLATADRFVFTTPASLVLGKGLEEDLKLRLSSIGSGFGFADMTAEAVIPPSALPGISPSRRENDLLHGPANREVEIGASGCGHPFSPLEGEMSGRTEGGGPLALPHPITYLGTVDFIKLHPGLFDAIDNLAHPTQLAIWGGYDPQGEVAAKARSMRHPDRIRFMGQTDDPQAALSQSRIFFYPLQPDHYGTAENALIEAMSLGLVPVVLANPAECAIVENGMTGFIATSIEKCSAVLDRLLASPDECARIGANAARAVALTNTPQRSVAAFIDLWTSLAAEPERTPDFAAVTGRTPLDWYRATLGQGGDERLQVKTAGGQSKGTLAHFRAAFPDHPCWAGPPVL